MSRFRDEMRIGRAVLHQTMGDGAVVFSWPPEEGPLLDGDGNPILDGNGNPVIGPLPVDLTRIQVRVHEKFLSHGDLAGTSYHYAEVEDNSPVAVFWVEGDSGFTPIRGLYFLTEYGRGYRIDSVFPKDDQTQNAKVIELLPQDMIGWPVYTNA